MLAQPVYPQATAAQLVVVGRRERFGATDRAILAVGAALFGVAVRAGSDTSGLGAAVTALVLGQPAPLAELLGPGDYRVVSGTAHGAGPTDVTAGYDWLRDRLGTPLVRRSPGPRFTAVVTRAPDTDQLLAHGWLTVASRPAPAGRLPAARAELAALEQRAVALGRPLVAEGGGLAAAVEPGRAAEFAGTLLAPLRELDEERAAELVRTLRTWLAHHGSWDRTAAALGVHRNSVRHRIRLAERALGLDLADPESRMELWFALRWSE
ncbi:PucR family transcriptional regulator [Amycolatopsis suaedae]|uniref:PucR family transcriptional regulator n=1 Tax=Amycolatopsis suaedae TaxID=2510978 RepID=A0A4Q7J1T8_9PSEU|nr:PucR family transcriptional regulator [Amycolatopsis suaedae]